MKSNMIKMKVIEKYQNSDLNNSDVKWYLFDEKLWVTKHKDYSAIEKSILKSAGSFNWLYESNDTMLFDMEGRFETAIIDLAGRIKVGTLKKYSNYITTGKKGDIFIAEKKYVDFEFMAPIIYAEDEDILYSFPPQFDIQKDFIILIVDDFGFVIVCHQLKGWFLKRASGHVCITREYNKDITPHMLARYLNALNLWEENDDATELTGLLEECRLKEDEFSCALRECIKNLL